MLKNEILDIIISNQLVYLTKQELVSKLKNLSTAKKIGPAVDELIADGFIMENEKGLLFLTDQKGYIKCKIIGNKKGFGFCDISTGKGQDIFISHHQLNGAMDGDEVLVEVLNRPIDNNPEGRVIKILDKGNKTLVGKFEKSKKFGYVVSDNDKFFKDIYIPKENCLNATDGDKVVVNIDYDKSTKDRIIGKIVEVLGKADNKMAEQLSIIRSFNLREEFPNEVSNCAKSIRNTVIDKDIIGRKDLRKIRTFTIDGADTRDVDDALSVEKISKGRYRIGVHIADVTHYVKKDSELDKEAFLRGTSVYFPDMVFPMLPRELSNGICSLNEGVDRLSLTVYMDIDDNAKVIKGEVFESVINVDKHLIYDDVTAAMIGDEVQSTLLKDYLEDFSILEDLTLKLEKIRVERGALNFDVPEAYIEVNDEGDVVNIKKRERTISHRMIESFMILANEVVAKKYFTKKTPFVYRIHEKPDENRLRSFVKFAESQGILANINCEDCDPKQLQDIMNSIADHNKKDIVNKILLRSMMKAKYSPKCEGHYGLGSTFYCHFTSPIRRYPDLAIHRNIKSDFRGEISSGNRPYYENFVEMASEQSSSTERIADEAERAVDQYKKCLYMKNFIGQVFQAIVSSVTEFGVFVELNNTIEGLVRLESLPEDDYEFDRDTHTLNGKSHKFQLGDNVSVILANVNEKSRNIDFNIEGVTPRMKEYKPKKKNNNNSFNNKKGNNKNKNFKNYQKNKKITKKRR